MRTYWKPIGLLIAGALIAVTVPVIAHGPKLTGSFEERYEMAREYGASWVDQASNTSIEQANSNLYSGTATPTSAVQVAFGSQYGSALVEVVSSSGSGTLIFQCGDAYGGWSQALTTANITNINSGSTGALSASASAFYLVTGIGGPTVRVTASAWSSGSVTVYIMPVAGGGGSGGGGGGGGGSVTQGTSPWVDNITQLGGNNVASAGQTGALSTGGTAAATSAISSETYPILFGGSDYASGTAHVELPKIDSSGNVYVNAAENGTWSVTVAASSSGGISTWNNTGGYVTSAATVDASSGSLYSVDVVNTSTSAGYYLEFFNAASGSVTLGTTVPILILPVPASSIAPSGVVRSYTVPLAFSTALSVACVTAPYGSSTAPASTVVATVGYK